MLNKIKPIFEVLTRFVSDLCIWRKLSNFVTKNQEEANASSFCCIKTDKISYDRQRTAY